MASLTGEQLRRPQADAAGASGNQRAFALQFQLHGEFPSGRRDLTTGVRC
jgi:hypothetical protein